MGTYTLGNVVIKKVYGKGVVNRIRLVVTSHHVVFGRAYLVKVYVSLQLGCGSRITVAGLWLAQESQLGYCSRVCECWACARKRTIYGIVI